MTSLFLIAHKVRGEPAFDVAAKMECPECANGFILDKNDEVIACSECDGISFWWVIPTSGHRAYPWWHTELYTGPSDNDTWLMPAQADPNGMLTIPPMPPDLPDHYIAKAAPTVSLAEALGIRPAKPQPSAPIIRRL